MLIYLVFGLLKKPQLLNTYYCLFKGAVGAYSEYVEVRGSFFGVSSLPLACELCRLSMGHWIWWQEPLPTEQSANLTSAS